MSEKLKVDIDVEDTKAAAKLTKFEKLAKKNQEAFSKFGGAVSGVGRFMGSTTSAAGGLLAEIGQISGVLGTSGGFGVAIAAASAGLGYLVGDFIKTQEEARKAKEEAVKFLADIEAGFVAVAKARAERGLSAEEKEGLSDEENVKKAQAAADKALLTTKAQREELERIRGMETKSKEDVQAKATLLFVVEGRVRALELAEYDANTALVEANALLRERKQLSEENEAAATAAATEAKHAADVKTQEQEDKAAAAARKKADADATRAERDAMRLTKQREDAENQADLDKLQRLKDLDKKREDAGKAELKRIEERNRAETKKLDDEEASILRIAEKKNQLHLEELNRKREEAERAAGYALEMLSFASGQVVAIAQLEAQLQTARVNGNADMVRQLEEQEKQLAAAIAAATLEQIAQIAIAHGTVLFMRGVGEMALGNAGAGVAVAQGLGLVAIGVAGMTGAGVIRGVAAGSQPPIGGTGDTSAPSFDSAPRQLAAPGQSGGGNVTTTYIVNGPAFGLNEDRAQRWAYGANRRGARLEGLRP